MQVHPMSVTLYCRFDNLDLFVGQSIEIVDEFVDELICLLNLLIQFVSPLFRLDVAVKIVRDIIRIGQRYPLQPVNGEFVFVALSRTLQSRRPPRLRRVRMLR